MYIHKSILNPKQNKHILPLSIRSQITASSYLPDYQYFKSYDCKQSPISPIEVNKYPSNESASPLKNIRIIWRHRSLNFQTVKQTCHRFFWNKITNLWIIIEFQFILIWVALIIVNMEEFEGPWNLKDHCSTTW